MTLTLDGKHLGEKHQNYNQLVKEAVANNKPLEPADFNSGDDDIDKLLKIDLASNKKDVNYILQVFKCEDMLYVSTAIKRCTWIITDQQYANIINPEYLNTHLLPQMSHKAFIKLTKNIRLHLKDEKRAELFFYNEKDARKAVKWLPNCSVPFIEKQAEKYSKLITNKLLKRLCEKSAKVFEIDVEKHPYIKKTRYEATRFLIKNDVEKYLDLLEKQNQWEYPRFGARTTDTIMKACPERIIKKFEIYCRYIHLQTFMKYIKKENVKQFLYDQATKEKNRHLNYFFDFQKIKPFINLIPREERFKFVNDVFINRIHSDEDNDTTSEKYKMKKLYSCLIHHTRPYQFYEFAPFETAFAELTKLIQHESTANRAPIFLVLFTCSRGNLENIQKVLDYCHNKHKNDQGIKDNFAAFVTQIDLSISDLDNKTWNIFNDFLKSWNIYDESEQASEVKPDQALIHAVIIYNIIHGHEVPKVIEEKLDFSTLENHWRLNQREKDKIFSYLYNHMTSKINNANIAGETDFKNAVYLLVDVLNLLTEFQKELHDYPWVLNKIKEFNILKKENLWEIDMSDLYMKKKSWKKLMFEESLTLYPCEGTCYNALKHDAELINKCKDEIELLRVKDRVSLKRLLQKLRIYWAQSLGNEWTIAYLGKIDQLEGHKALIRGLCTLLPRQQLMTLLENHAPKGDKIDFDDITELELSLQRHIAKIMHIARPPPPPEAILLYAKGDYLQYALPSLLAIFHNLNSTGIREHISKLLKAPVSIQKHGIRFAFAKLQPSELKQVFLDAWNATTNATIRSVIFKFTYSLLCKEKDTIKVKETWTMFEIFIDNLTFKEDKAIRNLLMSTDDLKHVPTAVIADFFMKSYGYLERYSLTLKDDEKSLCTQSIYNMTEYMRKIMEHLPSDFVAEILLKFIQDNPLHSNRASEEMLKVITAYVLCAKDENTQTQRYEKVLIPLIQQSFISWNEKRGKDSLVRKNFKHILDTLNRDLKEYVIEKNMLVPVKMFLDIQSKLNTLTVSENYIMLTKWKLTVELAKCLNDHIESYDLHVDVDMPDEGSSDSESSSDSDDDNKSSNNKWDQLCQRVTEQFGTKCFEYLKEDVKLYFSCIYLLFSKALSAVTDILPEISRFDVYERLLTEKDFIEGYLTAINCISYSYYNDDLKAKKNNLCQHISAHPSVEVKMHYNHKFKHVRHIKSVLRIGNASVASRKLSQLLGRYICKCNVDGDDYLPSTSLSVRLPTRNIKNHICM